MGKFRLRMNVGYGQVRYSKPLDCIDALKIAGAVLKATGTEPEIVPNTRTLRRQLAAQDAIAPSAEASEWGLIPPYCPNVPDVQPKGWKGWVKQWWDWLVNTDKSLTRCQ